MSVHIEYLDANHTTVEVTHDAFVTDDLDEVYNLRLFCDDGVEISGTARDLRRLADRINRALEPSTSSASRQHWVDTGEFLLACDEEAIQS